MLENVRRQLRQQLRQTPQPRCQRRANLLETVRIGVPQIVPVRYPRLCIQNQTVTFRAGPQPPLILEHVIRELFKRFLHSKPTPQKVGLSFKLEQSSAYFHVPLRSPQMNTVEVMAREVERHAQSQQGQYALQGAQISFKLSAQFARVAGACRRRDATTVNRRNEIDVSDSKNRWCLAYAIRAGLRRARVPQTNLHEWASNVSLEQKARKLLSNAGCSLTKRYYDLEDAERIQAHLNIQTPGKYRLVVVEMNCVRFKGPPAQHVIPLRYANRHFTLVTSLKRYFGVCGNFSK